MTSGVAWLSILAALAGPTVVAVAYARQVRRDTPAITRELIRAQQRLPKYIELRPFRWYHLIATAAVLALPFVQWFAYLHYLTPLSFLVPLGVAVSLMVVVGMLRPRFVAVEPPNHRETGFRAALLAAALVIALVLPASGTMTVLRGALSDILAILIVSYLVRVWNTSKAEAQSRG